MRTAINFLQRTIMIYVTSLAFLLVGSQGCENKVAEIKSNNSIEYPNGKQKNLIVLSDSVINDFGLTDDDITKYQYYLADDLKIKLLYENEIVLNNKPSKEEQTIKTTLIDIKKNTPCTITKKLFTDEEIKKLSKKHFMFITQRGYIVQFGDGISLIYDDAYKLFDRVFSIDGKHSKISPSYTRIIFESNCALLVDFSHPEIRYKNDTVVVAGKRKE